jgi:hypothetical protein
MLPSKNEMIIPVIYLIGIYIVLGLSILPEVLTLENQIPIWMSYLVFGYLFYVKLTSNKHIEQTDCLTTKVSLKIISLYAFVILVVSVAFVIVLWLSGIKEVVLIATWVIWNLSGLILLIYAAITPKLSKINSSK